MLLPNLKDVWHRCTSCRLWKTELGCGLFGMLALHSPVQDFLCSRAKEWPWNTSQVPQSSFTHKRLGRLKQPHPTMSINQVGRKLPNLLARVPHGQEWGVNNLPQRLEGLLQCHTHCNNICPREWSLISMVGILIRYSMLWDQLHPTLLSHLQGGCHSFLSVCQKDMWAGRSGNRPLPKYCQDWQT